MAMACAAGAVAVSSSAAFVSSSSRISPASSSCSSPSTSATNLLGYRVRCARMEEKAKAKAVSSRREVLSLATLSLLLAASDKAEARDVPLFGIRKKVEQAEKAVEKEVKELEKGGSALLQAGEKELAKDVQGVEKAVSSAVSEIESATPAGLSPTLQAGGVVGAELVAVLIASSVVNGLVSVPSE